MTACIAHILLFVAFWAKAVLRFSVTCCLKACYRISINTYLKATSPLLLTINAVDIDIAEKDLSAHGEVFCPYKL